MRLDEIPAPACLPGHVVAEILCVQPSVTEAQLAFGIPTLAYEKIKRRLETEAPVQLFGHEFCARIVETGPGVSRFRPGDRVAARAKLPCGDCPLCNSGRGHLCRRGPIIGFQLPGCFAEYGLLPEIALTGRKPDYLAGFRPVNGEVRVRTGMPGHFNVANALGAFAAAGALGVERPVPPPGSPSRRGCRGASSRSTRARGSPSSSTTPTLPTRWRTCCARRVAHRRQADLGLRCRRRPRPRQASADGTGRRQSAPISPSSPPTTRAPRTPRRSSPKSAPGRAKGTPSCRSRSTAAPRSPSPSAAQSQATRW